MSDDIERLKTALEDLRVLNDGLQDCNDATRDVVSTVAPVELETDPEGHATLQSLAAEIATEFARLVSGMFAAHLNIATLHHKARL